MTSTRRLIPRVFLVCSGLDHAHRGFESFARECFEALRGVPELDLALIKGTGPPGIAERSVPSLTRNSAVLRALGAITRREPFELEQVAFALSLQPELLRHEPDVVYFSEYHTGRALARLRQATRGSYRLAFSNGAMAEEGFGAFDLVQQLTRFGLDHVVARGADPEHQRVVPYGFAIDRRLDRLAGGARQALRGRLELPASRSIVLSVAALNRHHKRIDYLIEELARLPEPRPYLLMAGQAEQDTPGLRRLARAQLGDGNFSMRTVAAAEVHDLYRVSDVFVLASLGEAFGRVLVEALAAGLPCIAHDYPITRDVAGEHGILVDLSRPGALAARLARPPSLDRGAEERHRYAYENFSWERLVSSYVSFLREAAEQPVVSLPDRRTAPSRPRAARRSAGRTGRRRRAR